MENILLIEPEYNCKYPPLGLMKIAYYHKEIRKDFVWFTKGELHHGITPKIKRKIQESKDYQYNWNEDTDNFISHAEGIIRERKWDRIYISTLFTYEWDITVRTIEYAKTLVNDINKIYVGGILATLMAEDLERATGIKSIKGQLTTSSIIGYEDNENIDILTPDYSILDCVEYQYSADNAYFAYATRGCGMNCEFCAVKTLEPNYVEYISITDQVNKIKDKYGEKKDLLLMDNNVLKSRELSKITREIIDLGFSKGATYINPKTKKRNNRYVDFNQGLDAFLFTNEKVELLKKVAIRPARIAFDHIEDEGKYIEALNLAVNADINHLSNYLLYNGDDFKGKGQRYKADTPEDLYRRLEINVQYQNKINRIRKKQKRERIHIFSFPMRYIPLNDKQRGYIGANWNLKYLRAIQAILIPTQGKGVASKSFFEAAFGETVSEFKMILLMPEKYITTRGKPNKVRGITDGERRLKEKNYDIWQSLRKEWKKLHRKLSIEQKEEFINVISGNEFKFKILKNIDEPVLRKLYIHYFSESGIINLLEEMEIQMEEDLLQETLNYITYESPLILRNLANYIIETKATPRQINMYFRSFKDLAIKHLLAIWIENNCSQNKVIKLLETFNIKDIDTQFLVLTKWCISLGLLQDDEKMEVFFAINSYDNKILEKVLSPKYNTIFEELNNRYRGLIREQELENIFDQVRIELSKQMSFI